MKSRFVLSGLVLLTALTSVLAQNQDLLDRAGVKPIGDWQVDPAETAYLNSLFSQAGAAADAIAPGPEASAQRRAIDNLLRSELEAFLATNGTSAYAPGLNVLLGDKARMRSGYFLAMQHYAAAFNGVLGSPDPTALEIAHNAGGSLAKLLVLTGRVTDFDNLQAQALQIGPGMAAGYDWGWAVEMRAWVTRHPEETYKCGLYCLDQLGRTTQPADFVPKNVLERDSSPDGFTAADLVSIGNAAGLRVHAALLTSTNALPVPSIIHLRSEHFVFLREQRGAFFNVIDPIAFGPKWMTLDDILEEATGCVIVSDALPTSPGVTLSTLDSATAASYRGRCHNPLPPDHDDPGCGGGNGCSGCSGMAGYYVSEPWLNLWLKDVPLTYTSAIGAPLELVLSYTFRRQGSVVSGAYWRGAQFGNNSSTQGIWGCSWLSFAELSAGDATVDLMLPASGWATFNFPAGSSISTNNFLQNAYLEKQGPSGGITNLVLHYSDGSWANYAVYDKSDPSFNGIFYMTSEVDPAGIASTFSYDSNHYLTSVAAGDGTTFTVVHGDSGHLSFVTSVTTPYSTSVSMAYDQTSLLLTNIVDAAELSSQVTYEIYSGFTFPVSLITPYGTSGFNIINQGIFDRVVYITNAIGQLELYAQLNAYGGSDWPDFSSSQIPTNTPVGTLDIDPGERTNRNTFHWNAQQFAPFVNTDPRTFTYANELKYARIRHWLASTDGVYSHWLALSAEQDPSLDSSHEGQVTFFDYVGKPSHADYEVGTQILPSVVARAMPDGSTWYRYFTRLTNGLPTSITEAWMDSGTGHTRSNVYVYAANNIDLVSWTNALGIRVVNNLYNSFHQVVTNYDALGQVTTNAYDSTTHLITSSQNPAGLVTLYTYNANHRLQSVIDLPVNRTNSYTWNSDGTLATRTDARNMVETFFWDGLHRLTGTSDGRGATTNLYYLLSGVPYPSSSGGTAILDLTAHKDRLGHWTSYLYDGIRRKVAETNGNGVVTGYGYCSCGAVDSITNAWNTAVQEVTTWNLDAQGRLTNTVYADGYSVTNWLDLLGRVTMTGDGAANRWFTHNNLGLLTIRSNAYGAELTKTYDLIDRPVYVTDARGVMVTNTYDNLNRLITRGYPDGGVERFGYSAKGLTAYTNQLMLASYFGYDELGRRTYETNANAEIIKYTNNAAGDLLSLTDGKNQTTRWNYDQYGRVTNKVDQAGSVVLKYFYDAENRLTNRWSAAKGNTYYTNDAVGNVTYINYPSSTDVTLQYDPLNRLTNMVDAVGTTKYGYTAGNQVWTEAQPFSNSTITNTYVNRLRSAFALQQPTGLWTNGFKYDVAARLTNVASWAGNIGWTLATPATAPIRRVQFPNGSYIINAFDPMWRMTITWLRNSGNTTLDSAEYKYNLAGQKTYYTNLAGTTVQYTYDNIGQLAIASSSAAGESRSYAYDHAWNLLYVTNGEVASPYTVDVKNQLTSDPNTYDSYDANGNLTTRTNIGWTYSYDDENRLVGLTNGTAWSASFAYDGLGRLRKRSDFQFVSFAWVATNTVEYIYDGTRVIQERDVNNNPTATYTRGTDFSGSLEGAGGIGGLLARSSGYSSGNWTTNHFYHADGLGNITYLIDSSQAMAATYRYDSFGNTLSSSGPLADANSQRFSSKEFHPNSGMYIYLYRFYDPSLQRWLSRDPFFENGDFNLYRFLRNSPLQFVDPYGLQGGGIRPPCEEMELPEEGSPMGFGQTLRFEDRPPKLDRPIEIMPNPELSPLQAIGKWLHQREEAEEESGETERPGFGAGTFNTELGPVVYITFTPQPPPLQIINGGPALPTAISLTSVNSVPVSVSQPVPR